MDALMSPPTWPPSHIAVHASVPATMGPSDDHELLEAWQAGDRKAADKLLQRHYDLVRRTIRTKTPEHAVDDLTQRVFTALIEGHDKIREGASIRAYMLTIARRVIADFYGRRKNRPIADEDIAQHSIVALGVGPVTLLLERQENRLLLEALREIPLRHQFVLELYYWEDFSGPELAQALECTESAVRGKIRRAKEQLTAKIGMLTRDRREFADTVTDLDAWALQLRDELRARYPQLRPPQAADPQV